MSYLELWADEMSLELGAEFVANISLEIALLLRVKHTSSIRNNSMPSLLNQVMFKTP